MAISFIRLSKRVSPSGTGSGETRQARAILLVEDEPDIVRDSPTLSSRGSEVVTHYARTRGRQGNERAWRRSGDPRPDAADINGFQVRRDSRRNQVVPIIIPDRAAKSQDKIRGFEAGADDYVTAV